MRINLTQIALMLFCLILFGSLNSAASSHPEANIVFQKNYLGQLGKVKIQQDQLILQSLSPEPNQIEIINGSGQDLPQYQCPSKFLQRLLCELGKSLQTALIKLQRVNGFELVVNGQIIVQKNELNKNVLGLQKSIALQLQNQIKVRVWGLPISYVQLKITGSSGPNQAPLAQFSILIDQNTRTVSFDASSSSDPDGSIESYQWDFGDGQSGSGQSISHTYSDFGTFQVQLTVTDNGGLTSISSQTITLIRPNLPPLADIKTTATSGVAPHLVVFDARESTDPDGDPLTFDWNFGDGQTATGAYASHQFQQAGSYQVTLRVRDSQNAESTQNIDITVEDIILPPDPATVAPPIAFNGASLAQESLSFLYEGPTPIQTDVQPEAIDQKRASLYRGRILKSNGDPLSGVEVSALYQNQVGKTLSRADGMFDLVVNGGGRVILNFSRAGYFPAQRSVESQWGEMTSIEDLYLKALDPVVTPVRMNSAQPQVARGSVETDASGSRQGTFIIPSQTTATAVLPGGGSVSLSDLSLRITEYTVGENGLQTMPAALPPLTAYTYAAEFSADEAIAIGASRINFNKPLLYYLDNFLDLPVGFFVPAGYYEHSKQQWTASTDGVIMKIIGIEDDRAILSFDGTTPINENQINVFEVTDEERIELAKTYPVGKELWRMQIPHFSPWDLNFPYGIADGSTQPNGGGPQTPGGPRLPRDPTTRCGSIIEIENQTLSEVIPITGTPLNLVYRSDRVPGRLDKRTTRINLSGDISGLTDLIGIDLGVSIAGQTSMRRFLNPTSNMETEFTWDGRDIFNRNVFGSRTARVSIGFIYRGIYIGGFTSPQIAAIEANFARQPSGTIFTPSFVGTVTGVALETEHFIDLENLDMAEFGLGGWGLNNYHYFSPETLKLYMGDGQSTNLQSVGVMDTYAGSLSDVPGGISNGDGGPAAEARFRNPRRVRMSPSGELYIVDSVDRRVRKIDRNGIITTVAGGGTQPMLDGSLATSVDLFGELNDIAFAPNGDMYIALGGLLLRMTPEQQIYRVAGNGTPSSTSLGDGGPAINAGLARLFGLAIGPDGSIFLGEIQNRKIRRIGTNGIIDTYVGTGAQGTSGDGGQARLAQIGNPNAMVVTNDGTLYFVDGLFNRIRRVNAAGIISTFISVSHLNPDGIFTPWDITLAPDGSFVVANGGSSAQPNSIIRILPDGSITRLAGTNTIGAGASGFNGDGKPALESLLNNPQGIALDPFDGTLYIADNANRRIRRVRSALPGYTGSELRVSSPGGDEYFIFSSKGLHLKTHDSLTGALKYQFEHNEQNLLVRILDSSQNTTEIVRDSQGNPLEIISPYGQRTALYLNSEGYLRAVTSPANETFEMQYHSADGLLSVFRDPRGKETQFQYDSQGRFVREDKANGGFLELIRTNLENSRYAQEILMSTGENRQTRFISEELNSGQLINRTINPDLTESLQTRLQSETSLTNSDGSTSQSRFAADPVYGFQAPYLAYEETILPSGNRLEVQRSVSGQLAIENGVPYTQQRLTEELINGKAYLDEYNGETKTRTLTSPEGRGTQIGLDALGRIESLQITGLQPTVFSYDARGRLASSDFGSRQSSFQYNNEGFLFRSINPLNQINEFSYDPMGRVTRQRLADGREILFSYDAGGNITSITPPGRTPHEFVYNIMGLVSEYLPPSLGFTPKNTTYGYNLDDQLTSITRPDGKVIQYNYDPVRERLNSVQSTLGSFNYLYHPSTGQVASISSPDGVALNYSYDGSLMTAQNFSGVINAQVNMVYDSDFRLSSLSLGPNLVASYGYDQDGLMTLASGMTMARSPLNGLLLGSTLSNVSDSYSYNSFGEVETYTATGYQAQYTRDALGRITAKSEQVLTETNNFTYSYDPAGRLVQVRKNGNLVSDYEYDLNSNRTRFNTTLGQYDGQDRMLNYGGFVYSYNQNGDLTGKLNSQTNESTAYSYDEFGNLKSVTLPNSAVITYLTDAQHRRVGKRINNTLVQSFIYQDQLNPIAELDGNGAVVSTFVYAAKSNVPDIMYKNGNTYRIISDQLGSPRLVINIANNQVIQQIEYDEFGQILSDSNPGFQPFGFAGGIYDQHTKLTRFGARDYDAFAGRWTSKDPILFNGGDTNLYGYVLLDPVNFIDPTGQVPDFYGPRGDSPDYSFYPTLCGKICQQLRIGIDIITYDPRLPDHNNLPDISRDRDSDEATCKRMREIIGGN